MKTNFKLISAGLVSDSKVGNMFYIIPMNVRYRVLSKFEKIRYDFNLWRFIEEKLNIIANWREIQKN